MLEVGKLFHQDRDEAQPACKAIDTRSWIY